MATDAKVPAAPKNRAPTLYFIIAVKLIKGITLVLLALSIFTLANKDLPDMFYQFLQWVHLDPERRFFVDIANWLETITPMNIRAVALGMFLFGAFLIDRAKWAIWLAIGESAFFIPVEIVELVRTRHPVEQPGETHPELFHHPRLGMLIVLALNILIAWYLFENRKRLFRQHN
jgi:uncharacterized membrane protein (DUF2068 family)